MLGINGAEFVVLLVVALIVLGPHGAAQALSGLRRAVAWGRQLSRRLRDETAPELQGLSPTERQSLDFSELRNYDPREIVREAVQQEMAAWREQMEGRGTP